jgi:hypothetical protein
MSSSVEKNEKIIVKHKICIEGRKFMISIEGENKPYMLSKGSLEHFFKEHQWGFGISKKGSTLIYRVEHPFWEIYPVKKYSLDLDFGRVYGKNWEFLNSQKPFNITLAAGSDIKVFSPQLLSE